MQLDSQTFSSRAQLINVFLDFSKTVTLRNARGAILKALKVLFALCTGIAEPLPGPAQGQPAQDRGTRRKAATVRLQG